MNKKNIKMKYEIRNFTNIDDEDFVGKWGGEEYTIKAGETKPFLSFLCAHFAKHLADRIMLKDSATDYKNAQKREPLIKQMLGEVVAPSTVKPKQTEGQKIKEEVEKAQEEFADLDKKTKKAKK